MPKMTKVLFLGDPHVQVGNLDESERLLEFTLEQSKKSDRLVIPGDLFHTHANVRVEVLEFWDKWLNRLSETIETVVLVGNHDQIGNYTSKSNALSIFKKNQNKKLDVVSSPIMIKGFGYLPYIHDKEKFVAEANELTDQGCKIIIVHQDLDGAQYENGFYCPDGVKQEDLKANLIIGGHIHKRSRFGKVILPGTARWLNSSDKNEPKGLWLATFDEKQGIILEEEFLDTSHVCTPIYSYKFEEGDNYPEIPEGSRASVELIGTSDWISKQKPKFKGIASVSSTITDKVKPSNRKTGNNFQHFITNIYEPSKGIDKEKLINVMKEMGIL